MATIPSPRTWTSGETPSAVQLNDLRDAYGFLMNPPRVKVYSTTGQSIDNTDTLLTWDAEIYDSDGMHSTVTNPSRLTAVTAGVYEIVLHLNWEIFNNANPGNRYTMVKVNGAGDSDFDVDLAPQIGWDTVMITPSNATIPQTNHLSVHRFLNAGDYVEASAHNSITTARQTIVSGAAQRTFFAMRWIGAS